MKEVKNDPSQRLHPSTIVNPLLIKMIKMKLYTKMKGKVKIKTFG